MRMTACCSATMHDMPYARHSLGSILGPWGLISSILLHQKAAPLF